MEVIFERLLKLCIKYHASDVHFTLRNEQLKTSMRTAKGIVDVKEPFPVSLLHYLKFIANLDLGNATLPQSGNFTYAYKGKKLYFRFAYLYTNNLQSGVLRILNNHQKIELSALSKESRQNEIFEKWSHFRSGLTIMSGPTGSGKTTTLHAMLEKIALDHRLKVIALEDPIEMQSEHYLQLQINERIGFGYEEGISQLLRHDPDVIMIGEVRDSKTAKTLIRCALSGHMVFTTLHAKSCVEAIYRLLDFGVKENDLKQVLTGITNQRIFPSRNQKGKVCIYEIMEKKELEHFFTFHKLPKEHKDIFENIKFAMEKSIISKSYAQADIEL